MILYVHFQCDCDLTFWNMLFLITEICIRVYMRVNMCVCLYHVCNTLNEIRCRSYLGICISSYSSCLLFVRLFFFFSFFISQCFQIICPKIFELLHYISLQYITSFVHVCKISEFAVHLALRRNQSSNHTERWMFYCKWCKVSVLLDTIYKQPPNNRIEF